ncbi:MAG: YfhO family protein [Bacteroidota bacterium]
MLNNNRHIPYLLFLLIAIVAFSELVLFEFPPIYDMMDCFYPWRFHVGECLQNGQFPYWNPYQDLGYPAHADPSSGAWYPFVWILGATFGYNSYTIALELVIHIFFAACGMYLLAQTLGFRKTVAFITAVSFMLCGVFIGNAQHLPYVIGAAWLPFLLHFYFKMIRHREWYNAVAAAFFLFLMITGGYPAYVIILFYFFVVSALYFLFKSIKNRQRFAFSDLLARHIVFVFMTALFSLGQLISIYQVSPYLIRLDHFSLEYALYSPFGFKAFLSFVLPYSTVNFSTYYGGDISMINGYFGLLMLLFMIAGIFIKKSKELKLLFYFGIFCLLAAVGSDLPIRKLLFDYVPMMNVFRFPAVFRLFALFSFILIAGNYLNKLYIQERFIKLKHWIIPLFLSITAFVVLVFYLRSRGYLELGEFARNSAFTDDKKTGIEQHFAFQAILQTGLLLLFTASAFLLKNFKHKFIALAVLVCIDMITATKLNAPYTIHYSHVTAKEAYNRTAGLPKGFPAQRNITIEESGKLPQLGQPYWQNMQIFQKQISAEGYNSFSFTNYDGLESKYPFIFKTLQSNHLVLLSDQLRHEASMEIAEKKKSYKANQIYLSDNDFSVVRTSRMNHVEGDTAFIKKYDANYFNIQTNTQDIQLLTLFQKNYTGWKARINGEKTPIYTSNKNFMTIIIPQGKNTIEFVYTNYYVLISFYSSIACTILFLIYTISPFRVSNIYNWVRS